MSMTTFKVATVMTGMDLIRLVRVTGGESSPFAPALAQYRRAWSALVKTPPNF